MFLKFQGNDGLNQLSNYVFAILTTYLFDALQLSYMYTWRVQGDFPNLNENTSSNVTNCTVFCDSLGSTMFCR